MTLQSRPLEAARARNWASADPRSSTVKGRNHKAVPEYEKPRAETGSGGNRGGASGSL